VSRRDKKKVHNIVELNKVANKMERKYKLIKLIQTKGLDRHKLKAKKKFGWC